MSLEHIEWADLIFVMEEGHLDTLLQTFGAAIKSRRVICLNIPDEYQYMDPRLVLLLNAVVPRYLPAVAPSRADA